MTAARVTWAVLAFFYAAAVAGGSWAGWAVFGLCWWIGDFVLEITL